MTKSITSGDYSEIRVCFYETDRSREVEVTIRNSRVKDYKDFRNRRVHFVKHEQTTVLKGFIELGLLITTVSVRKTSDFILLCYGIREIEVKTKCLGYLLAQFILTRTSGADKHYRLVISDKLKYGIELLVLNAVEFDFLAVNIGDYLALNSAVLVLDEVFDLLVEFVGNFTPNFLGLVLRNHCGYRILDDFQRSTHAVFARSNNHIVRCLHVVKALLKARYEVPLVTVLTYPLTDMSAYDNNVTASTGQCLVYGLQVSVHVRAQ